jgi:hypothetical protein
MTNTKRQVFLTNKMVLNTKNGDEYIKDQRVSLFRSNLRHEIRAN